MRTRVLYPIFAGSVFSCLAIVGLAQVDTTLTMESQFTSERKLFLKDANKLSTNPLVKEQIVEIPSIKYSTLPTRKTFTIDPQLIPAAKVNIDQKLPYYYRGFVRAGFGTYNTVPVDVYYTDGRSRKGTFGLHYQLYRSDGVVLNDRDSIPDRFSDNRGELWAKRFFNKFTLGGALNWERNVVHWYGVNNEDSLVSRQVILDSLRQRLNTFGGRAYFETFVRDSSEWNYNFDLGLRNTRDLFQGKETNFDLQSRAYRTIGKELYTAEVGFNYNNFAFTGPNVDRFGRPVFQDGAIQARNWDNGIIKLAGHVQTVWKDLRAKAGAGIYFDLRDANRPARAYPMLEVAYSFAGGVVVPYVGVTGGTTPTTFLSLFRENPFIQTFPDLNNLNTRLHAYGGIGGAISRSWSYKAGVNYHMYENFAFFVNDSSYFRHSPVSEALLLRSVGNKMAVVYDAMNVLNFFGELALFSGEKWKANVRADYFRYEVATEQYAWNQPGLKLTGSGQYKLREKFIVSADLFYIGARWAKSTVPIRGVEAESEGLNADNYVFKLKGFLDMNFKVEYRYNRRLSLWGQANNALALKYQRYSAYPTQQLVALLGATFAF
jgi:hypothetical protein